MEPFSVILTRAETPTAAAILLMLSWIASCDGEIAERELEGLRSIGMSGRGADDLSELIDIARAGSIEDLQLACEVLRNGGRKHRRLIIQMAIGMALADGYMTTAEGHIVRFIADVLYQSPHELDEIFREMTGERFPPAADPSSIEWWESRERRNRKKASEGANSRGSQSASSPNSSATGDFRRLRDLAVLGLDEEASNDLIRAAYRRMAKIHHPDRYVTLGPEAVRAAEVSFCRIQDAYERLVPQ